MHKRSTILALLAAILTFGSIARGHEGVEHIMGTVKEIGTNSITVDTVKKTTVTVLLNGSTKFTHNGAAASLKDFKVGQRVVIDAKANAEKKLVASSVRWGAGAASKTGHE